MRLGEDLFRRVDDLWWDAASCGGTGRLVSACTYGGSCGMLISWRVPGRIETI